MEQPETLELVDRISNLPEDLIGHILSFLPTKYAVGTSALSTFWKNQWTSIPNLEFDDMMLINTTDLDTDICVQPSFVNFIHRVLDLHKAPRICQFRIKCLQSDLASHLNTWISTVLARKVQKLELDLRLKLTGPPPCEIFSSRTLVELRLGSRFSLDIPTIVCVPNLRSIYLHYIKFLDKESSSRLFSSCPVLEELTMIYCSWGDDTLLSILSPTVKRLTVKSSHYTAELDIPHLEQLNYVGHLAEGFLSKRPEFVAKVCFHTPGRLAAKETIQVLARAISKVQYLYLSGEILEIEQLVFLLLQDGTLKNSSVEFQPFCNLRTLVIGYNRYGAWQMLSLLLEKCPNLKYLELNDGLYGRICDDWYSRWVPSEVVPAFPMLLHLEGITVHAFKGYHEEIKTIKYFLVKAIVLKKLTIKSAMDAQEERKLQEILCELLHFRWMMGFSNCELVFT